MSAIVESIRPIDVVGIASFILGSLTFLITYIRASINKSNRDIDRNTITSLKDSNSALVEERDMWKERANKLEGQNKVLQETVTAAPEIARLTEMTARQHNVTVKWQKDIAELQKSMLTAFKNFVDAHELSDTPKKPGA